MDLKNVLILKLKLLGIKDIMHFDYENLGIAVRVGVYLKIDVVKHIDILQDTLKLIIIR